MTKVVILFLVVLNLSCSSENERSLAISEQNLFGKWYINGGTTNNGAFQNYQHACSNKRDFQEFVNNEILTFNGYNENCELVEVEGSAWSLEGNTLTVFNFPTDSFIFNYQYVIEKLTSNELILKQNGINEDSNEPETYRIFLTRN